MNKYLKEYKWSNIRAMLRNNKVDPIECQEDFTGRLVLITGATTGIGYHTAIKFASKGANLLCINRNEEKSINLCEEIMQEYGVECNYKIADFTHLDEIKKVATDILALNQSIDVLIHNAGVYLTKKKFTDDDIETVFQVNYLGSFILNYMLKDKLKAQNHARIIFVNSEGHRFAISGLKIDDLRWKKHRYTGLKGYGSAKVAQLLSMLKFKEYFNNSGVTINAMHPGDVKTNMGENNGKLYRFFKHHFINPSAKSPKISAESLYYLGVSKNIETESGKFFNLTTEEEPAPPALDMDMAERLWDKSLQLVGME
ncbi:SDR family NAD(P)-dependent oxidoreductase [Candidatus Lokiarchaeum ossiferum]|uniref:SDR family NAD(P)-dependent oxidoreductase n=1 Tax=Candidatus Lokiarchaeum ossiferum TaxID=2951803 RepID=UPI00352D1FF3